MMNQVEVEELRSSRMMLYVYEQRRVFRKPITGKYGSPGPLKF